MKPRRLLLWLVVVGLLLVLGLVVANVTDYVRFHRAIARAKGLTEAELRALGDRCRAVTMPGRFEGSQAPAEFRPLEPLRGDLYPGCCDVLLYELGEVYLWVRVDTSPNNQRIHFFTNSAGPQTSTTIWQRHPDLAKITSPDGRLVTVAQWSLHGCREWVVLENAICVFDRPGTVGSEDTLLASAPLAPGERAAIIDLVRAIRPEIRGKGYCADGVMDGISLSIRFTPAGDKGSDDVELSNVWIPEIGPLLNAISRLDPPDIPVEYQQIITRDPVVRRFHCTVHTLKEIEAMDWPPPRTPWWCVWRSLRH